MSSKGAPAASGVTGRDTHVLEPEKAEELRRKLRGQPPRPADAADALLRWHLESLEDGGRLRRVSIHHLPFRIGRRPGLELTLPADSVSKAHAEIYWDGGGLRLRDLGSTNGTFVNGEPVEDVAIREGDVLHFADYEFRVGAPRAEEARPAGNEEPPTTVSLGRRQLSHRFVPGTLELKELLKDEAVTMVFQPIVLLPRGTADAYEALGRGRHPRLPESPLELFRIAESMGAEAELSRLFRRKAVELVRHRTDIPTLFLNTHPVELSRPGLLESLEELRRLAPHQDLALEIHESVLTRPSALAELRTLLSESNISLAYDDFGAGQARLLELAEAPPHYLKFDRRFVDGVEKPDALNRRQLLGSLVEVARDMRVRTIAEGIETAAEARICAEIGFSHGQGYHFGRPVPVEEI
jgi:EAL domain-containing protein (putative c-di-GMP-specific phosphodiesterase class I)